MTKKLISAGAFGVLFLTLLVAVRTVQVAAIGPEGTMIGLSELNLAVHEFFGVHLEWYDITELLGYSTIALMSVFVLVGLLQLVRRKSLRKLDREIFILAGLYAMVVVFYVFFEKVIVNYRPIILPGCDAPEASFPSTHTMLACTVLGSTVMLLQRYVKKINIRKILQALCVAVAIVIVIGRLASGVHWFTDIIAGVLLSGVLLSLFAAFLPKRIYHK